MIINPVDNFGTIVGENLDCLLLSGTVAGENPDHVCWEGYQGGGVQHGVWTYLHSFLIIRESIDITIK